METESPPDVQARVEQLLRQAHILRMRQQWGEAETLCRQALELAPDDAMGQEMLADLLAEKGSLAEALELYRKAYEVQPQKTVLEAKIARLVLQKDQEEQDRLAAELLISSPRKQSERKRNVAIVLLLSLLCPGAGQIANGQYVKGGILAAVGLLSHFFGGPELLNFMLYLSAGSMNPRGAGVDAPNGMLAFLGLLGGIIWIYSLLDASAQAGKSTVRGGDI
jgi:tetratricopeptide (TPR) repeat protein